MVQNSVQAAYQFFYKSFGATLEHDQKGCRLLCDEFVEWCNGSPEKACAVLVKWKAPRPADLTIQSVIRESLSGYSTMEDDVRFLSLTDKERDLIICDQENPWAHGE